jgi:serine/threonine protein kinase
MGHINLVNLPYVNEQGHPLLSGGKTMDRDRNLLFGVLAVQLRKVTPTQLVDIAGAWAMDPSRCLGNRLLEAKIVSPEDKVLLDGLVDQAIKTFDGDASLALESFGGEEEVYHSFRGSVAMTDSGGIKSVAVTKRDEAEVAESEELGDIPAVEEMPSRYTYVNEYGRGGMGRVLLVHDEVLGRDLALKELLPNLVKDGKDNKLTPVRLAMPLIARFLQEAKITGQLEHPSIVPVYELGHRKDGTLYYTMKLVRGKTLHKAIHECKNLEERLKLLPHFVDLCNAIAYAHKHGVIHRDIKPMNVMIGEFGETVVLDWGLAKIKNRADIHVAAMQETVKALNLGDDALSGKTRHGDILGTPLYMPPEQAKGDLNAIDERSDIYSLGAVLYEILTGNPPFGEQNVMQTIYQVINETPKSIASQERRCPPDLIQFCNKAMEKLPENRYQKAKELADAVEGSKLRPPKSRLKKYLQRAAIFLIVFIPCCTVGLNIKSERDLANLKAHYEARGISMAGNFWETATGIPAGEEYVTPDKDPLGAIYALEWQFPEHWNRKISYKEIFSDISDISRKSPYVLDMAPDEIEHLRFNITMHEDVLQQVRIIAQLPRTPVSEGVQNLIMGGGTSLGMALPNLLALRHCANLLRVHSLVCLHDGDTEGALAACLDIIRFADHLNESPSLISAMIRVALTSIGCEALQDISNYVDPTPEEVNMMRRVLEQAIENVNISHAFRGELAAMADTFELIRTEPGKAISENSHPGIEARLLHLGELFYGSRPLRFWLNGDAVLSLGILAEIVEISKRPYFEAQEEIKKITSQLNRKDPFFLNWVRYPISMSAIPNLLRARMQSAETETYLNLNLLALGIKQYRKDHGTFPETLESLAPQYMAAVPVDPITNEPFVYQYDEDGYTLYGAGIDGEVHLGVLRRTTLRGGGLGVDNKLEKYRAEHGVWPESFEELVPEYLNEVPLDFMTGQPLTFTIKNDKPNVWVRSNSNIIWVGW